VVRHTIVVYCLATLETDIIFLVSTTLQPRVKPRMGISTFLKNLKDKMERPSETDGPRHRPVEPDSGRKVFAHYMV
jgi:hypothetical protein